MAAGESHLFSICLEVFDAETQTPHRQVLSSVNVPCQRPVPTLADWSSTDLAAELHRRHMQILEDLSLPAPDWSE